MKKQTLCQAKACIGVCVSQMSLFTYIIAKKMCFVKIQQAYHSNELGDILASAYKISSKLADEMWQYIVDLNVDDDVANAKFYVAQVFNKISDRLSPEEAKGLYRSKLL